MDMKSLSPQDKMILHIEWLEDGESHQFSQRVFVIVENESLEIMFLH